MSKGVVSVKFNREFSRVRLVVSLNENLSNPIYSSYHKTKDNVAKIEIDGLNPVTKYYYGVEVGGILQTGNRGSFKTFATPNNPASFTCAFASCATTGSTSNIFTVIKDSEPDFFIHMGDLHYSDIGENDLQAYRNAYDNVFTSPTQSSLYSNVPTAYIYDDHDYSTNDGTKNTMSRPAVLQAYRERVPHHPLAIKDGINPCYHSFVYGRVRFILTDLRSMKDEKTLLDIEGKSNMGEEQLQWFFNELLKPEPFKIWVNTISFIGTTQPDQNPEDWRVFTHERKKICNFIKNNDLVGKVAIISGDMHGIAIDNGVGTSNYADGGGSFIPVFQAAALDRPPSLKGGPWSEGVFATNHGGQYGVMTVNDDGVNPITFHWKGMHFSNALVEWTGTVRDEVDRTPPIVAVSHDTGTYNELINVKITTDKVSTIYYTLDGSTPTVQSEVYTQPIIISSTTTLKYYAVSNNSSSSPIETKEYTVEVLPIRYLQTSGTTGNIKAPPLTFDEVVMIVNFEDSSSSVKYLIDFRPGIGSTWIRKESNGSFGYGGGVKSVFVDGVQKQNNTTDMLTIGKKQEVRIKLNAVGTTEVNFLKISSVSAIALGKLYDIKLYNSGTLVAHYDINTNTANDQSGNNHSPLTLLNITWGVESSVTYPFAFNTPPEGTYDYYQYVTLSSNQEGGTIYYTLDGSTPNTSSLRYTDPIEMRSTTNLKYLATDSQGVQGYVQSSLYTISYTPRTVLKVNGAGYLKTPIVSIDEVEVDFVLLEDTANYPFYFLDLRPAVDSTWLRSDVNGSETSSGGTIKLNNAEFGQVTDLNLIKPGVRTRLNFKLTVPNTTEIFVMNQNINQTASGAKSVIMDVKLFNNGVLVAHYDTSTGAVNDKSGNGHDATYLGDFVQW